MKKYAIGFNKNVEENFDNNVREIACQAANEPKKSIVEVYFPHRGMGWTYYNDSFDLKVGDWVYVDGKLEGYRGQVKEVNYSFKIKLSDYKRVIAVLDTNVDGDFYFAGSHIVSFDKNAIPFSKVLTWFKAPENDAEYVSGDGEDEGFSIDDLSGMKITHNIADRGYDYFMENKVVYAELDGNTGHAIVEGRENYEIEFNYINGEISNLKCSCYCSGACKHEFAAMLQLQESLELITQNYSDKYNDYFAAISKGVFVNTLMNKTVLGKISLGV